MGSDALKIVTHDDVEPVKRPFGRTVAAAPVDTVDPSKLMDMLGDIDSLKREIQDRVRRIEAVKQAKSLLMEDALRTEALNKRLAEIGKVMSAVHSGFLAVDADEDVTAGPRWQSREPVAMVETRPAPVLVMHEAVALAWPKVEEAAAASIPAAEESEAAAVTAEASGMVAAELPVAEVVEIPLELAAVPVETQLAESAPVAAVEEPAPVLSIAEVVETPVAVAKAVVAPEVELSVVAFDEPAATAVAEPVTEEAAGEVGVAELEAEGLTVTSSRRAEELVAEARRLLEESTARLDVAAHREEMAAEELRATQESLATVYQSATAQLTEAERFWRLADDAATEARRLFEDSTAQLTVAVSKEQQSAADFHSAQQALTAAYQAAIQRLEAAEQFSKDGEGFALETRKLLDRMESELGEARNNAQMANGDLLSARQELTTAYQFASVAAQRRLDSAEFFRMTASWVVFSTAFAWIAAVWMAWAAFHRVLPLAIPFAASCLILAVAIFIKKRGARALEEA